MPTSSELRRDKELAARESILEEQQAEVARQEGEALALQHKQLQQQQEVERARVQLSQQRSALEAAQAQVGCCQGTLFHPASCTLHQAVLLLPLFPLQKV